MKGKVRDQSLEPVLGRTLRAALRDGGACPDAETLAAWSEDGLVASQRSEIDAHLAECARCQAAVAAVARSAAVQDPSPARASNWLSWKWLAPAAAAGTALALWIVMQPDSRSSVQRPASIASDAKLESPSETPNAETSRLEPQSIPQTRTIAPSQSAGRAAAESLAAQHRTPSAGQVNPPASRQESADRRGSLVRESKASDETSPVAAAPPVEHVPLAAAKRAEPLEIVSSDRSVRWRIQGSQVEHTTDGGATWTKQPTGTTAVLTAGSSPSPDVCWIVGQRGTVLRSIDGRTWRVVPFPDAVDLVQVESASPTRATVMTADARHFTTTDSGATWKSGGLQEF